MLNGNFGMTGNSLRRIVIEASYRANAGHISSALCICDIISVLYDKILKNLPGPDRDRFILSKGHAALAQYSALYLRGLIQQTDLESYCKDGTLFGVHPEFGTPGIEITTGSLGMGLSAGAGLALSAKMKKSAWKVYVLISDAECNEGSIWEAVMFAAHHHLSNLMVIVDDNGMQALGKTREVLDLQPLESRFQSFGWNAQTIDGHDPSALESALKSPSSEPRAIIAKTTAGKGVSFMENKVEWHYLPLTQAQAELALKELKDQP
jgi:transketolase